MKEKDNLLFSSAVLCLSPTMEFARNKTIDNTILQFIAGKEMKYRFTLDQLYKGLRDELPIRKDEIEKSIERCLKNNTITITEGSSKNLQEADFILSKELLSRLESQSSQIKHFLYASTEELLGDLCTTKTHEAIENMLLETVAILMAKYGFACAGQVAGIMEASEFIPIDSLREICENVLKEYNIPDVTTERLMEAVGGLFDRRDPCLNNLAFSLCQRYYSSRLIGMDLPIDFLSDQVYKNATFYLDTNFIHKAAFSKSGRYNEFKEILKFSSSLGINFAVSEITIAELQERVADYIELIEASEELVPSQLLQEVEGGILEEKSDISIDDLRAISIDSKQAERLRNMGIKVEVFDPTAAGISSTELEIIMSELEDFDRKWKAGTNRPLKDSSALYHDAQLYFQVKNVRDTTGNPTSGWYLTVDNSVIAHGIENKNENEPPYSIKLPTLLHTLSPFIESQALIGEFEDLFVDVISRDLLPKDQLFSLDDLKMLVGFDINAKSIPPEFVRKATNHIKREILKGGGLTEENKPLVIHEFTKYFSSPEKNLIELQSRYEKKINSRDEDLLRKAEEIEKVKKNHEKEVSDLKKQLDSHGKRIEKKDEIIKQLKHLILPVLLIGISISLFIWFNNFTFYISLLNELNRPVFLKIALQLFVVSGCILFISPKKLKYISIAGFLVSLAAFIASLS